VYLQDDPQKLLWKNVAIGNLAWLGQVNMTGADHYLLWAAALC
jgi:hypothetical protein